MVCVLGASNQLESVTVASALVVTLAVVDVDHVWLGLVIRSFDE